MYFCATIITSDSQGEFSIILAWVFRDDTLAAFFFSFRIFSCTLIRFDK